MNQFSILKHLSLFNHHQKRNNWRCIVRPVNFESLECCMFEILLKTWYKHPHIHSSWWCLLSSALSSILNSFIRFLIHDSRNHQAFNISSYKTQFHIDIYMYAFYYYEIVLHLHTRFKWNGIYCSLYATDVGRVFNIQMHKRENLFSANSVTFSSFQHFFSSSSWFVCHNAWIWTKQTNNP